MGCRPGSSLQGTLFPLTFRPLLLVRCCSPRVGIRQPRRNLLCHLPVVWPSASSPFASLSPGSLPGHYPLSHKMEWHLGEQEAICHGPK